MIAYAQIVDDNTKQVSVGLGKDESYYESIGMTKMEVDFCKWNGYWYVKGYIPQEPEPTHEEQIAKLKMKLKEVDEKSTRSIRSILAGTSTEEDKNKLEELEALAKQIRAQIKELEK